MAKHGRDQALDFQGFLNDLQDWELSVTDKDKKMKPQASQKPKLKMGDKLRPTENPASVNSYPRSYGSISHLSSSFMTKEDIPDATSEKELGNEYFKQKKFKEAIDCYSRSIAFSPTAVAYANRAMAYLKIKRFQEAEDDCTDALNLDDRYIKAYSRRATARKELGKLKDSMEDCEFALRLEPFNQEIKKQFAEVKSLYAKKRSGTGSSVQGGARVGRSVEQVNGQDSGRTSLALEEVDNTSAGAGRRSDGQQDAIQTSDINKGNNRIKSHGPNPSVQELASRAATRALSEAAKSIKPPKSAFEFETSWRGFAGDQALQACLLKATSPADLPQIFKNALSVPILVDVVKCVATFFTEEMDLGVKYLENLTKVPRFGVLIMCLPSTDKADVMKIWNEIFCNEVTPIEYREILDNLRTKYCLKR